MTNYQHPPGIQLRTREEPIEATRQNKVAARRRAKRGWATRRRNDRALDRMIAEAVARDTH